MNDPTQNPIADNFSSGGACSPGEDTLRLIASLPAPEGLSDRVQARLLTAPRTGRVLAWPAALAPHRSWSRSEWMRSGWMQSEWMRSEWIRSAAAAAIVLVVAGGGWSVYSHVQQPQAAKVIVLPPRVAAPGSFANAGAMRTPQTLNGPLLAQPVTPPTGSKAPAKSSAPIVLKPAHSGKSALSKTVVPPAAPAAR